jgi:hypothetical protein
LTIIWHEWAVFYDLEKNRPFYVALRGLVDILGYFAAFDFLYFMLILDNVI